MKQIVQNQKLFLKNVSPMSIERRVGALKSLKSSLKRHEQALLEALQMDLGKSDFEAYVTEIGYVYQTINFTLRHIKKWARPKRKRTDLAQVFGKSYVYPSAHGVVLIIGPFNYPVQLLLEPLIGAIAGGNTAILKPSELTPTVEKVLVKLIEEAFKSEYVSIVTGSVEKTKYLLTLPVDYIFFTGSERVGKYVMQQASQQLIPVTLELGGKSPVIVDKTANLKLAATRIAWGKFINAGQTCVAPDYVMVHATVYEEFLQHLKSAIYSFYGKDPLLSLDYGRIVNTTHVKRLEALIDKSEAQCYLGATVNRKERYISPTVFEHVSLEDILMQEEIFGPLLPTMTYRSFADIDVALSRQKNPLAFYVFSENKQFTEKLMTRYKFGGGCVNDTITHVASQHLPFGGVGSSGMGRYHGKYSFDTFTYEKAIVKRSTLFNVTLAYPPYKDKLSFIKKLMK